MLKKVFGGIEMKWWKVIVFAILMGIYVGLIALWVPEDWWWHDIAVTEERWILPAVWIIVNCKKPLEAAAKTFVFFLISQPLVYLVQVPFATLGWQLFSYYKYWFMITLLTFPGAFIGWFIKKDNILSGVILSVVLVLLAMPGIVYAQNAIRHFPKDLGGAIYCFGAIVLLIFAVFTDKKPKLTAAAITLVAIIVFVIYKRDYSGAQLTANGYLSRSVYNYTFDWTIESEDESIAKATMAEDLSGEPDILLEVYKEGETGLILTDPNGKTYHFVLSYDKDRESGDLRVEEK